MHGLSGAARDLRSGIRVLRTRAGFSAVAIVTLALAIGANAATFSFVHALLLSPLPYPDSDRIVRVLEKGPNGGVSGISTSNYLDWTRQNGVFDYVAAEVGWRATSAGGDRAASIAGARVSAHYFDIFGIKPALGRTFREGDDQPGSDRVVLLTHALWEARFGADAAAVGRKILLNGEPHTVIGVLPAGPFDRARAQIWKPLAFPPSTLTRSYRWLAATARLKPGVTVAQAQAEMDMLARRLAAAYPDSNKGRGAAVDRLADVIVGPHLQTAVTVLFVATLFVLLVGCANLANLALARGISREGEFALRAALGASRWHLIRLLLIENLVISVCGGILGVGVGYGMMAWIQSLIPPYTLPPAVDVRMDASVLLFTLSVSVVTGLLFGVAPAAQQTTPRLAGALRDAGHGTTAVSLRRGSRRGLVVAEVALAFVLLVASGLLVRSFFKLLDVDLGFNPTNVLTATLPVAQEEHPDPAALNVYLGSIEAAVKGVPGVRETALASALPLEGWGYGVPYSIAGRDLGNEGDRRHAFLKIVSPSYFRALGIKLLSGRTLSDSAAAGGPPVTVINERLARREFGTASPLGHRVLAREIVPGKTGFGREIAWEIVGVIADEKITGLGDDTSAGMYVSNRQSPTYGVSLVVQAAVPPASLEGAVRSAVERVNSSQVLADVRTLDQILDLSLAANRFVGTLLAAFAMMALLLAAAGIYGVMSFTAAQRRHEIGIRIALGATVGGVRKLLFWGGMRLALLGLACGLLATVPATDLTSSMLYGVTNFDPLTILVVAGVLSAVAALASYLPGRQVANVDPGETLRRQ